MFNQYLIALDVNGGLHPDPQFGPFLYLSTNEFKPWKNFEYKDLHVFETYDEAAECVEALKKIWPKVVFVIRQPNIKEEDLKTSEALLVTDHSLSRVTHTYPSKVEIK